MVEAGDGAVDGIGYCFARGEGGRERGGHVDVDADVENVYDGLDTELTVYGCFLSLGKAYWDLYTC